MTSLTMIFGLIPLMFASGVGANGNISIGVGTVGGVCSLVPLRFCLSCRCSSLYFRPSRKK